MTGRRLGYWALIGLALLVVLVPAMALAQGTAEVSGAAGWVTLAIAVLAAVVAILREFAPKTPNTLDDSILALLSQLDEEQAIHLLAMLDPGSKVRSGPTPNKPTGT